MKSVYIENIEDMCLYDVREDSIIYQGEKHWTPIMAKDNKQYKLFTQDWHRAGIKAQRIFKEQAIKLEYMLEELSQTQETLKSYTGALKEYKRIKRGDFLIRNVRNFEIDVKCRIFYTHKKETVFDFNVDHLDWHMNMYEYV